MDDWPKEYRQAFELVEEMDSATMMVFILGVPKMPF